MIVSGTASPSQLKRTLSAPTFSRLPFPFLFPPLLSSLLFVFLRERSYTFRPCIASQQVCRSEEKHYLGSLPSAPLLCPIPQVNNISLSYSTAMRWPHWIYLIPLHHLYFISFFANYLCLSQYLSSFSRKNKNGSRTQLAHVESSSVHVFYLSSLTIDFVSFVHSLCSTWLLPSLLIIPPLPLGPWPVPLPVPLPIFEITTQSIPLVQGWGRWGPLIIRLIFISF